jgi:hypothetical protein
MLKWQRQPGTGALIRQFMFEWPYSTPLASGRALCTQDHSTLLYEGGCLTFSIEQRTPDLPTGAARAHGAEAGRLGAQLHPAHCQVSLPDERPGCMQATAIQPLCPNAALPGAQAWASASSSRRAGTWCRPRTAAARSRCATLPTSCRHAPCCTPAQPACCVLTSHGGCFAAAGALPAALGALPPGQGPRQQGHSQGGLRHVRAHAGGWVGGCTRRVWRVACGVRRVACGRLGGWAAGRPLHGWSCNLEHCHFPCPPPSAAGLTTSSRSP